ncbi:hypothetical protein VSR01_06620 [Actinacidiphila sp. DG2A-62]|uniref:hypothetical protein n=1 Tax=Actinacidiphila sp. DG2A-62 TaxID=3108821 RepID=UPI002DB6D539|nr:hypothetical protein [Actinacidiphila sp. DG2A-62]MEC3993233.1 hypothetical protein [Actinacidiphila sp. DG2A-62]
MAGEDRGRFVGSASDEQFAQLLPELPHLRGVAVAQFRVLLDQRVVAGVARGIGGRPGTQGEQDRAQLLDGLGDTARRRGVVRLVRLAGRGDQAEQLLLPGEDDLLLVAEVAKERGASDLGAFVDAVRRLAPDVPVDVIDPGTPLTITP